MFHMSVDLTVFQARQNHCDMVLSHYSMEASEYISQWFWLSGKLALISSPSFPWTAPARLMGYLTISPVDSHVIPARQIHCDMTHEQCTLSKSYISQQICEPGKHIIIIHNFSGQILIHKYVWHCWMVLLACQKHCDMICECLHFTIRLTPPANHFLCQDILQLSWKLAGMSQKQMTQTTSQF